MRDNSYLEQSYLSRNFWRFDPKTPYQSPACDSYDGAKAAEPPSLAASGSACDYRQISHDSNDHPVTGGALVSSICKLPPTARL
jgi:hypothetical protein